MTTAPAALPSAAELRDLHEATMSAHRAWTDARAQRDVTARMIADAVVDGTAPSSALLELYARDRDALVRAGADYQAAYDAAQAAKLAWDRSQGRGRPQLEDDAR